MKSLAEHLGVTDPKEPEKPVTAAGPIVSVREFCREILHSIQYRESLLRRILIDDLPPAIEAMIWDRAYGKVRDRIEIETTMNLDNYTSEELEQRALLLYKKLRQLRMNETGGHSAEDDLAAEKTSVH